MFVDDMHNSSSSFFDIDDAQIERRLSEVARLQLFLIAAKAFEATEQKILSTIDSALKTYGCDPQDALVLGLCTRRMSLLYRLSFKRYKKFGSDGMSKLPYTARFLEPEPVSFHSALTNALSVGINRRRDKHKAMYDALTTAYSLIYSGSKSPHSKNWKEKDNLSFLGDNFELKDLFIGVRDHDRRCIEENRDDEDDSYLKMLFLERGGRGGPRKTR